MSNESREAVKFRRLKEEMKEGLRENGEFRKVVSADEFSGVLAGGIESYADELEEQGIKVTLVPGGIELSITDGNNFHLKARALGQKRIKKKVWEKEFSMWSQPPIGFDIDAKGRNSRDREDRITVRDVNVKHDNVVGVDVVGLLGVDLEGEIIPQIQGFGLFRLARRGFKKTMKKEGYSITSFSVRITPKNNIRFRVEGGRI